VSSFTLRWLSKKCTLWRERAPIIVRSVKSQPSLGLAAGAFFLLAVVGVGDLRTNPCMLPGVHSKFRRAPNAQAIFCRRRHQPRRPPPAKIRPGSPAPATGSSSLAVGLLLSPRYALGDVGFLQGFQILFEPWQQVSNRIGHCLQTHSLRLPQIVECLFAPVYRALRVADPVTDLSQCQFSVIHRGPLNATCVAASPRPRALDGRRCDLRVNECTGLDQPSQHYHHCRQTQNCHCEKYFLVGRHL